MLLKNFRSYQLAVRLYRLCEEIKCAPHLKEQLSRASSSIALNLAEGSARATMKDRRRYYNIAMGSVRECQTILDLMSISTDSEVVKLADQLGAGIYKLNQNMRPTKQERPDL
jgi:four helix bundle protein